MSNWDVRDWSQGNPIHLDSIPPRDSDLADRSLIDAFLSIYQPTAIENRYGATIVWLHEARSLAQPCPALGVDLHALAANRVAARDGDTRLAQRSRHCYSKALQELNKLLSTPESIVNDQTLAAIRCLMIYEVRAATCPHLDEH